MDKHKVTFTGKIEGTLRYDDKDYGLKLAKFKDDHFGLDFVLTIHAIKDAKSYAQQAFYFGVVLPAFMEATGTADKDDQDFDLRKKFLKTIRMIDGEQYVHIPSLQIDDIELDKASFAKYIENCLNLLFEMGGRIPDKKMTDEWRV